MRRGSPPSLFRRADPRAARRRRGEAAAPGVPTQHHLARQRTAHEHRRLGIAAAPQVVEPTGEQERQLTETVNGPASAKKPTQKASGAGLKIKRVFSTEGVHPYDEMAWERRDVVQTNWKTGETVFEQRGVEFPDFWSVNA